jgi:hypothetical protein
VRRPGRAGVPPPPAAPRPDRRRRLALAAGAVLVLAAVLAWAALSRTGGVALEAADPTSAGTSASAAGAGLDHSRSATVTSSAPSPTDTPTPPATVAGPVVPAPAAPPTTPTTLVPTTPRTPGPNERTVPDVFHRYAIEADYIIRSVGLVPELTVVYGPNQCYVTQQTPAAGTIVPVDSTVALTVTKSRDTCEPI